MGTQTITIDELIDLAHKALVQYPDTAKPDRTCRAFASMLIGSVQAKYGQAAADLISESLGMHHLVGNCPERLAHLRSMPLLNRAEMWKAGFTPTASTQEASHV
jgi:hypothetical protein